MNGWMDGKFKIEETNQNREREKEKISFSFCQRLSSKCVAILSYFRRESDADADEDAKKEKDVP